MLQANQLDWQRTILEKLKPTCVNEAERHREEVKQKEGFVRTNRPNIGRMFDRFLSRFSSSDEADD